MPAEQKTEAAIQLAAPVGLAVPSVHLKIGIDRRALCGQQSGYGQGVVGALAAVGLRLAGQDGRVKGKRQLEQSSLTVWELLRNTGFDRVCAYGQGELPLDAVVCLNGQPVKAVYQNFCATVLTVPEGFQYRLLSKDQLKCF